MLVQSWKFCFFCRFRCRRLCRRLSSLFTVCIDGSLLIKVMFTLYRITIRADTNSWPIWYDQQRHRAEELEQVVHHIEHRTGTVGRECLVLLTQSSLLGPVPVRPISANPGLKFCSVFVFYLPCVAYRVTFCVIITVNHLSRNRALNIDFRLIGFQSYFLLIHLRHGLYTCSHYTKVWHRAYPISDTPLSRSARRSFAPLKKSHPFLCVNRTPIRHDFRSCALDSCPV